MQFRDIIKKETVGTIPTTYAYDANGNITAKTTGGQTQTYTYGNFNRLTSYNGTEIAYDVAGNPLNWVNGITEMTFSRHNLLTNVTANGTEITYDYDGYGKRIRKTVYGDPQEFYYCGDKLIARKDTIYPIGIGEETQYKYWYFLYDNTGVYGMVYDGETYLYSKNILGDITGLYQYIDGVGLIPQAVYEYDAWGACTVKTAFGNIDMDSFSIGNLNPFRYRGYFYDQETGFYYLQTRYYDPAVGRFLSPDNPDYLDYLSFGGLNLYAYCYNNPISYCDPSGHMPEWLQDTLKVLGAAAIVVSVTALTVATAGFAAYALGASAAMIGAITTGAAIGGLVAGGLEIGAQIYENGIDEMNLGSIAIESFAGSAYGAISGVASTTTSAALRLGMRGARVALGGLSTALHGINDGDSFGTIMSNVGTSIGEGILIQGAFTGLDAYTGKLSSAILQNYALDGALNFGTNQLLLMSGILVGKNVCHNRGLFKR